MEAACAKYPLSTQYTQKEGPLVKPQELVLLSLEDMTQGRQEELGPERRQNALALRYFLSFLFFYSALQIFPSWTYLLLKSLQWSNNSSDSLLLKLARVDSVPLSPGPHAAKESVVSGDIGIRSCLVCPLLSPSMF